MILKRILIVTLFVLFGTGVCKGQLSAYHDRALSPQTVLGIPQPVMAPIAYGQVRVCNNPASGSPCTPVASIFDLNGNALSVVGGNFGQVITDVTGQFSFQCNPGTYQIQVAASASNTPQLNYLVACPSLAGLGGIITQPVTFTGAVTATGPFTCKQFDGDFCVDPANAAGWAGANASAWLNAAIAAAAASGIGGAHVHIFPGNYNLTANVNLASKVSVDCPGGWANTTLTWTGGAGPNAMLIGGSINDFAVRNCHLVGPNATTTGTADVRGIEIDGTSRGDVEYNKITGMSYGIFETSGGSDMQINHNWVQTSTTQGIVTYDSHVEVKGNRVDSVGTSALHHGIYASGGADQVIEANQISNVQGYCIQGFASVSPQINTEIKIIGNGCEAGGQAASGSRGGIIVGFGGTSTAGGRFIVQGNTIENIPGDRCIGVGDGADFNISGNICHNFGNTGILISSALAAGIQSLVISGNTLDTNTAATNGPGIDCEPGTGGVKYVTITGNQISSVAAQGIKINGCLDGTITGNQLFNFNTNNVSGSGIDLESGSTGWTIGNNRARSTAATGFCVAVQTGAVDNIVQGNIDLNCAGALLDNGTRTIVYGEKVNSSDKNFQLNSPGAGLVLNGSTSGAVTITAPAVAGSVSGAPAVLAPGDTVYGTYRVTADQTITAGASLAAIPGLSWTMPANTALNIAFSCHLLYNESVAATSAQFGIQDVTVAPTNITAKAQAYLSTSTFTAGNILYGSTTTAQTIVTFTPSAATTIWNADIDGLIEQSSNASTSVIQMMAQFTTNNGTIKRGSYCRVW